MATFLSICQKVDTLLGSQGAFTSVTTTNGFQLMIVEYVKNAWNNIQSTRKDWNFYRKTQSFSTVASQMNYTVNDVFSTSVDPVENWVVDRFIKDSDLSTLEYVPYDRWIIEDHTTAREPKHFTVHPSSSTGYLSFDNPDDVYTYTLHYFRKPQELSGNTDVPICPTEHHDLIVWQALSDLAQHFGNTDMYSMAAVRANQLYSNLLRSQCPAKSIKLRPFA